MTVINLDALIPDTTIVLPDGNEYPVPGDLPIPTTLRLGELADRLLAEDLDAASGDQVIRDLYAALLAVFQLRQPDLEEIPVGPRILTTVTYAVINPVSLTAPPEPPAKRPRAARARKPAARKAPVKTTRRKG